MHLKKTISVALILATAVMAQTTGIPGINDMTINGVGSGATSPVVGQVNAGDPLTMGVWTYPFSPLIGVVANGTDPDALPIDATYSVDVDLPSILYAFDGTGVIVPTGLSPFAVCNSAGRWVLTVTTTEIYRVTFGTQIGIINPIFPSGLATTQAFDVHIQAASLVPNGIPLTPLSDDGFIQVNFVNVSGFNYYGTTYSTVFVNMNGSLSFVSGNMDPSPTQGEFLVQQPRIAAVWADWNPGEMAQGTVRVLDSPSSFQVEWNDVRTHQCWLEAAPDTNTFAAILDYGTGDIELQYGALLLCSQGTPSTNQIVGITHGFNASLPNNVDLSAGVHIGMQSQAIYEDFGVGVFGPFDLSHITCCLGESILFSPFAGNTAYYSAIQ